VRPDFLACNQQFFGATVAPLNFADPHSVDIVNNWASEKTHGRITHIADGLIDPTNGRLLLANAVYFKGKWSDPFEPRVTRDRTFYLQDGSRETIPMMSKSRTFTYQHGTNYQAVRLPYKGENLAMYVFLPDANSSLEKLLSTIDGDIWQQITKPGFIQKDGDLMLPKFKIEYSLELTRPLQKLGMRTAFDMDNANFSGIASEPGLHISAALQKTFVEVKEEGTEAAAVTALAVAAGCMEGPPPKRFTMIVDRPFLLLIEENQTGTILFMGLINDPS
jgi:serpin B